MPLARIDLPVGTSPTVKRAVGAAIREALHEALGVPMAECFQVIAEHDPGGSTTDPDGLDVDRSPAAIVVQVTLNRGRDADLKRRFFQTAVELLERRAGIRPADVVFSLVEVGREDWSFGDGNARRA